MTLYRDHCFNLGVFTGDFMAKEDKIQMKGSIVKLLPNMAFEVELENGKKVLSYASGKMRTRNIRLTLGDKVLLEMSTYDLSKARIIYRER